MLPTNSYEGDNNSLSAFNLRVGVIGEPKSGKSSFIRSLTQPGPHSNLYVPTEGFQVTLYTPTISRTSYSVQLWDCGSRFKDINKHLKRAFFSKVSAAIIIVRLSDPNCMEMFADWVKLAYDYECFLLYCVCTHQDQLEGQMKQRRPTVLRQFMASEDEELSSNRQGATLIDRIINNRSGERQITAPLDAQLEFQTLDSLSFKINQFFEEYGIRYNFQKLNDKISLQVLQIFIRMQDDQRLLSRSSLVRAVHLHSDSFDVSKWDDRKTFFSVKFD